MAIWFLPILKHWSWRGSIRIRPKCPMEQNKLKLRIYAAKPLNRCQEFATSEFKNSKWIKTVIVKGFVDGSLGSHTAAFKEPYSDQPSDSGSISTVQIKSMNGSQKQMLQNYIFKCMPSVMLHFNTYLIFTSV